MNFNNDNSTQLNIGSTTFTPSYSSLMDPSKDFEIYKEDLDLIHATDPLRVQSVSVRKTGDAPQLLVRVLSRGEPVMLTELEVITVQKKRRLLSF